MIEKENTSSSQRAENRRKTGKRTRADRLAEIGKRTRFKPGQKSPNPAGRPRTAKFSEAMRQVLAEVNPSSGETNAELLARHCFQKAMAGSARHLGLALSYVEGKPPQAFELSGRNGRAIELANMTDAEIDARLRELLDLPMMDLPREEIIQAPALAPPAPAIDNSTVPESIEIIRAAPAPAPPAAVTVATTPVKPALAEYASGKDRDAEFFLYTTGRVVSEPAAQPRRDWPVR